MSVSFYDASVASFLQILEGMANVLDKGANHAAETGLDLNEVLTTRFHDTMHPFDFQVVAAAHLSWGAMQALSNGSFSPPSSKVDKDYAALQALVADARDGLAALDVGQVDALAGGSMLFKVGDAELAFTNQNFLLSFAHPNFYFHATTTYSILRMLGVPLGKQDFLGPLKIGA